MKFVKYAILSLAAVTVLSSCERSASDIYDNKVFIDNYASSKLLYVSIEDSYQESLVAVLPKPAESQVKVKYSVDEALVAEYNQKNGTEAVLLPSDIYEFSAQEFTINQGSVRTGECVIDFKNVLTLDKSVLYVLPVKLTSDDMDVLPSRSTKYYVFEGANLINYVADMYENWCTIDWHNPSALSNLKQFTIEMLLNGDWDKKKKDHSNNENSSIFGIEGYFLVRAGDLQYPNNRIQVCTNDGEPVVEGVDMPYDRWFNLIITYDVDTKELKFYIDGTKVAETTAGNYASDGGVTFAATNFKINNSYNNVRYAAVNFSEVRVWNKILDEETISDKDVHPYFVDPMSNGLVAYWKFNEGTGKVISDRTGNGNNAIANSQIQWRSVALPAIKK